MRVTLSRWCSVSAVSLALASVVSATAGELDGTGQAPGQTAPQVLVTGEVRYPGRVTLTAATLTVPDALAAVGSPTNKAGEQVIVIHPSDPRPSTRRTIRLADVDLGTPGVDLSLEDGDIVNVPVGNRFYISGFVRVPGAYRLVTGTTVQQAIVLAGGLSGGSDRHIKIDRAVNGKVAQIAAQLGDVVRPSDVINVPRRMF